MARPIKDGLDYFPFDVNTFEDEKIEAISGEFGIKGELFVVKLLCAVYQKGYFVVWNDLTKSKLLKRVPGASKELLDQIVNRLVTWGFFNEDLFNSAKVLTSEDIQATYFEATKRRKSPKPTLYVINDDINEQVDVVNDDINTQSKVNESKVNKTKEKEYSSSAPDGILKSFQSFQKLWYFPNDFQKQDLMDFIETYSDDLVDAAIKVAGTKDVKKSNAINFIESCLQEWADANITNLEQAREYQRQRGKKNQQSRQPYHQAPQKVEEMPDWSVRSESKLTPEQRAEMAELEKMFND